MQRAVESVLVLCDDEQLLATYVSSYSYICVRILHTPYYILLHPSVGALRRRADVQRGRLAIRYTLASAYTLAALATRSQLFAALLGWK